MEDYLKSKCIERPGPTGICRDINCPECVKLSPEGRWFITMGHAGFNSPSNNRFGYETKAKALAAMKRYLFPEGILSL